MTIREKLNLMTQLNACSSTTSEQALMNKRLTSANERSHEHGLCHSIHNQPWKGSSLMIFKFDSGLPIGEYLVRLNRIELIQSRELKPTIAITFDIVSDESHAMEGQTFTLNQVIDEGFKVFTVNGFVSFLCDATNPENGFQDNPFDVYAPSFCTYGQYEYCMKSIGTYIHEMNTIFRVSSMMNERNKPCIGIYETDNTDKEVPTYREYLEAKFG